MLLMSKPPAPQMIVPYSFENLPTSSVIYAICSDNGLSLRRSALDVLDSLWVKSTLRVFQFLALSALTIAYPRQPLPPSTRADLLSILI